MKQDHELFAVWVLYSKMRKLLAAANLVLHNGSIRWDFHAKNAIHMFLIGCSNLYRFKIKIEKHSKNRKLNQTNSFWICLDILFIKSIWFSLSFVFLKSNQTSTLVLTLLLLQCYALYVYTT